MDLESISQNSPSEYRGNSCCIYEVPKTENFGVIGALIIAGVGFGAGYLAKGGSGGGHGGH